MFQEIDLHGMTVIEAKGALTRKIKTMKSGELTVIHGYSSRVLQQFVRKQFSHPRIEKKILTMNPGETILVIKK